MAAAPVDPEEAHRRLASLLQEQLRQETVLAAAIGDLEARRWSEALEGAQRVLRETPDHARAVELAALARQVLDGGPSADELTIRVGALRGWLTDLQRTASIEDLLLKWPSVAFWERAMNLRADGTRALDEPAVRARVSKAIVTLALDDVPLERVVRELQAQAAIDITLDPRLRAAGAAVTVRHLDMHERTLVAALDAITADGGWQWTVDHGSIVVTPGPASGPIGTRPALQRWYYDVRDLVASATPVETSGEASRASPRFASVAALADAVRGTVDPASWRTVEGASVDGVISVLVVQATAGVQRAVAAWLEGQRAGK